MRLRLLHRYLLGEFLRLFSLTALSVPLLFILADMTARLDAGLAQQLSAAELLAWYSGLFPIYLTWAFPIAALVATLFTLQPLARDGEIHAVLSSGIRIQRLFTPLLAGGAAFALLGVIVLEASPRLTHTSLGGRPAWAAARPERVSFAFLTHAGELLSVQRLEAGARGRMYGVVLRSATTGPSGAVQYIVAKEAQWIPERGWVLHDGQLWSISPDGEPIMTDFSRLVRPTLTVRPSDLLDASAVDLNRMTFHELGQLASRMAHSGASPAYPRLKQWERLTIPLTTLAIILFAAPLATLAGRGERQLGIALSLVLTIVYLALLRTTEALGSAGLLAPGLAASLPALLFGVGGIVLFRRART